MNQSLNLGNAVLVTLIGMVIVFLGLTVLIALINLLVKATNSIGKKKAELPTALDVPEKAEEAPAEDTGALIAAITAAIACMLDRPASSFTVKHVRHISHAPAWQKAGRQDQINSRF